MKLYIAGPMSGIENWNYPAFNEAQAKLEDAGYEILNPARQADGLEYDGYLALAMADVFACDGIAVLPGYRESPGAQAEIALADALKKPVSEVGWWRIKAAIDLAREEARLAAGG